MHRATRPNCQPLTLSHLEFDGDPTVSMPAPARPHCILAARNSETLTIFSNFERKHYVQVRRNYGRQPSNQLRGARGASAHACSTGLSTGRHLMPMTSSMEHGDRRNKDALRAGVAGAGGCARSRWPAAGPLIVPSARIRRPRPRRGRFCQRRIPGSRFGISRLSKGPWTWGTGGRSLKGSSRTMG